MVEKMYVSCGIEISKQRRRQTPLGMYLLVRDMVRREAGSGNCSQTSTEIPSRCEVSQAVLNMPDKQQIMKAR